MVGGVCRSDPRLFSGRNSSSAHLVPRPAPMTTPAAPVFSFEGSKVKVSFDAPQQGNAMLYLNSSKGKQFYDATKRGVLEVGKIGELIPLTGNVKSVDVTNLLGDRIYTATIAFRGANAVEFGPTSPASAPFTIVSPVVPEAPLLEAMSSTEIRVTFVAPPRCGQVDVIFDDGSFQLLCVSPDLTLSPSVDGCATITPEQSKRPSIVVKGLSDAKSYKVTLKGHNGCCWGLRGPWSKPLKLANHVPKPPGAPFLDKITQDSVRVSFSLMPTCSHAIIFFKRGSTVLPVDNATHTLGVPGTGATPASKGKDGVVVSSLLPDTLYEVYILARYQNFNGWSDNGPSTKFCTPPAEVEITGTKTQEERDAELRENAVDVESEPPTAKRAKKEKK